MDRGLALSFFEFDCSKAIAAGLTFQPVEGTVKATLLSAQFRPADHQWRAGISRERDVELLR
jgi:hypothetical protein